MTFPSYSSQTAENMCLSFWNTQPAVNKGCHNTSWLTHTGISSFHSRTQTTGATTVFTAPRPCSRLSRARSCVPHVRCLSEVPHGRLFSWACFSLFHKMLQWWVLALSDGTGVPSQARFLSQPCHLLNYFPETFRHKRADSKFTRSTHGNSFHRIHVRHE